MLFIHAVAALGVLDIHPISSTVESEHELLYKYQPLLFIESGCQPFPAVDINGNKNPGLKAKGNPNGGCRSSPGQAYGRFAYVGFRIALFYMYFFPKDEPEWPVGHRFDWEGCIVWLNGVLNPTPVAISVTGHGGFHTDKAFKSYESHPRIGYASRGLKDHELVSDAKVGEIYFEPLVDWDMLDETVKNALDSDWGDANFLLGQKFRESVNKAYVTL